MDVFDRFEERMTQTDPGDDVGQTVDDLYARYRNRLLRVILNQLWHGETGPETVIQCVLLSVAGHIGCAESTMFPDDELRKLLFRTALRHCNNANHRTKRRGTKGASL